MSRFVQIQVPHVEGPIFALDEEGKLWQTAGLHDGRLAWIELPTDQRFTSAPMMDGHIVSQAAHDLVYRPIPPVTEISSRPS